MNNSSTKASILLVDDDILIAESNKILLKKAGYNIAGIACDGKSAIELALEKKPDLILMDVNLNCEIDGIDAAEEIQKFADIPFIFLTAYSDPSTVDRAKKIGPFGYLIKPFENRELLVAIETTLYKHYLDKKIKEQEFLFRTVANFAYEWEFWIMPDLQFKYCSPSCERVTGYKAEEFINNPQLLFDIIHPEDKGKFEDHSSKYHSENYNETVKELELRIIHKNGNLKFIRHTCNPIISDDNKYLGRRVTNVDITDRKQAENKLKIREELLSRVVNNIDEMIYSVTFSKDFLNNKVNFVSEQVNKILGYNKEEFLSDPKFWFKITHPDDLDKVNALTKSMYENKKSEIMIYRMKHKFREDYLWIEDHRQLLFDERNNIVGLFGAARDITERKHAEESLRESEDKYRLLFENMNEGVAINEIITDNNGEVIDFKFIDANSSYEKHTGHNPEKIIGRTILEILPNADKRQIQSYGKVALTGEPISFEYYSESYKRYIHVRAFKHSQNRFAVIFQDVSEIKEAEELLKLNSKKFTLLTSTTGDGFCVVDTAGKFIDVNEVYCQMIGYSKEEILNKYIYDLEANETSEEIKFHIDYLVETGFHRFESRHKCKDGRVIEVEVSASFSEDLQQILVFLHDITHQKIAEKQLRISNLRYETLFTKAGDGIVILSTKGEMISVNESFAKMHGYDVKELINRNLNELNTPSTAKFFKERMRRILAGESLKFEAEHYCKNGEIINVEISTSLISIGDEKIIQAFNRNITDRKISEEEIRKLSTAVEQSQSLIIITDVNANIEYVNPYFTEVTGYKKEEVLNRNPRFLKSGEISAEEYLAMWTKLTSGISWAGVFRNKKKNGDLYWESTIITPVKNQAGAITHYIAVKEDITEKVAVENELKKYREHLEELVESRTEELDRMNVDLMEQLQRQKELEMMLRQSLGKEKELNELKTRFISTASHEFRTPLTSVLSSAELIQRYGKKWSPEKINDHIERIKKSVDYVTKLLDEVLTMSRVESGKIIFQPELINLFEFCSEIFNDVKSIYKDDRNFFFNFQPDEKEFKVDRKLLKFILSNLLSNACKYSLQNGKIELDVFKYENHLIFEVRDEGIGIPENDRQHLFEPFFRCSNSSEVSGTGLGLSIVKQSVELHNGEISVNSKLGEGSIFTVKLKL